ncbi:MAG: MarR family transcriptional regulator [Lentisphaerae bacterium]|nr:MAG: MarR family transcriptional regulator [Lentisphaerota bacterium]
MDPIIQSLERGLAILKLLAEHGPMSGAQIARHLGVHQSTASRLLNSMLKHGFIRKPGYHRFALDYGTLVFAGQAMQNFPLIRTCVAVCNLISNRHGVNSAAAILYGDHLLYLTQSEVHRDGSLRLINDSAYPLHRSTLGRLLAVDRGRTVALSLLAQSIREKGSNEDAESIYIDTLKQVEQDGILYLRAHGHEGFNAATLVKIPAEVVALAIYSNKRTLNREEARELLRTGSELMRKKLVGFDQEEDAKTPTDNHGEATRIL